MSDGTAEYQRTIWAVVTALVMLLLFFVIYKVVLTVAAEFYLKTIDNSTWSVIASLVVVVFGSTIPAAWSSAFAVTRLFPRANGSKIIVALGILIALFGLFSMGIDLARHSDPTIVFFVHGAVTILAIYVAKLYIQGAARA